MAALEAGVNALSIADDPDAKSKLKLLVHCTDLQGRDSIQKDKKLRGFASTSTKYDKAFAYKEIPAIWFFLMSEDALDNMTVGKERGTYYPFRSQDSTGWAYSIDIEHFFKNDYFIYKLSESSETANIQVNYLAICPDKEPEKWEALGRRNDFKKEAWHELKDYSNEFVRFGEDYSDMSEIRGQRSTVDILSIQEFQRNPNQANWKIEGKCTVKSARLSYPAKETRRGGNFFNFQITDDSGTVLITGFNDDVGRYFDFIEEDTVYSISGCNVEITPRSFELIIGRKTKISNEENGQTMGPFGVVINIGVVCSEMSLESFNDSVEVNHWVHKT